MNRMLFTAAASLGLVAASARAQQPATVTGRVSSDAGAALPAATVFIESLGIGTQTGNDGRYTLTIPAARVNGQRVRLSARLIGFRADTAQITLSPGTITHDFTLATNPLRLGEVVVTGAGTATQTEKLGSVRNTVDAVDIVKSNEPNIVQALAAKAPNVEVTQSSGEPGASSYIRMRGARTILGSTQPLFVVDGVPIDNSSFSTTNFNPTDGLTAGEIEGTAQMNRAIDLNPSDIESIEILKGPAAGAIYGARAGQGVVLITTKKGKAGTTKYGFQSSATFDNVSKNYPLQRSWGQGLNGANPTQECNPGLSFCTRSWGARVNGPTYDHANDAFDTGHTFDNAVTVSGGSDRTTFYGSGAFVKDDGPFIGPNNQFQRASARINGSQRLTDRLELRINGAYADTRGHFTQRGNNTNGLLLGLLRTPPNFNNRPYLDPTTGQHRSYRFPNPQPGDEAADRGFSNPLFELNVPLNTSTVGRTFGNLGLDYSALAWLRFSYTLGADYSNDERLEGAPLDGTGPTAGGRVTEGTLVNFSVDHNLTGTADWRVSDNIAGTVTLGQNLNVRNNRQFSVVGRGLVAPQPYRLANTVNRDLPIDIQTNIHNESYFGQATIDIGNQLFLTGSLRNDGSSTFGEDNQRAWFPKASAAWTVTNYLPRQRWVTYGKLRAAYGEAGVEPLAYLTSNLYTGTVLLAGISQGTGLSPTEGGFGGLYSAITKGAEDLKPERTKETEVGFDVGLVRDKADLSFTWYNGISQDVIFLTPLAPSTGYYRQAQNAAKLRNRGMEVSLNMRPISQPTYGWDVGLTWAQNKSKTLELRGVDFIRLDPNNNPPYGIVQKGQPVGVLQGTGWAKCGVSPDVVGTTNIASACAGAPKGAVYLNAAGFPILDPTERLIGDPNPDWTGSIRTGLHYKSLGASVLFDIRHGGQMADGTRGALRSYGTHKDTENRATCVTQAGVLTCTGNEKSFGSAGWYPGPVVGPGVDAATGKGKMVPIGENWWRVNSASDNCVFSGAREACMEDAGYTKLREVSLTYTLDPSLVRRTLGIQSMELRLAGRNLYTWTKYGGYDPESNLGGAIQGTRGVDYFNMPQTRSVVFSVNLTK
jgi:TonB-linked SusC/RagA family outer membrane protein